MTNPNSARRPGIRQAKIAELIAQRGKISVETLAQRFDTSTETIRRDLTALANAGQIQKIHGGAKAIGSHGEGVFDVRMRRNSLAKRLIAEKAITLVKPHQTIFMDTGSTTLICAEALCRIKNLTIITNSTRIAATFGAGSGAAKIYLLGGEYRADNAQTVGAQTIAEIGYYQADMAILTIGAITPLGASDYSNHEAMVARAMQNSSSKLTLLVDHSKFSQRAAFKVCPLENINFLVSNKKPDELLNQALLNANVEVI